MDTPKGTPTKSPSGSRKGSARKPASPKPSTPAKSPKAKAPAKGITCASGEPTFHGLKKFYSLVALHGKRPKIDDNVQQQMPKSACIALYCRALDKKEYLMIIRDNCCLFCIKTYVVTTR